jgi:hypothetical protein
VPGDGLSGGRAPGHIQAVVDALRLYAMASGVVDIIA